MSFTDLISLVYVNVQYFLVIILRLALACILGGLVGYERENMHRPAGFRTHILVCVGAALVMITSEYIFKSYSHVANVDPARLGAQVISGIGFLGAGTIIREGFTVKGLTTAASLWAVSCVGLACGIGFYEGAIIATTFIFITLIGLKKMEDHFTRKNNYQIIYLETVNIPGQLGLVGTVLGKYEVSIRNIEFIKEADEGNIMMKLLVKFPKELNIKVIEQDLYKIEGVRKVF